MQTSVPQFIDVEDKVVGPFTVKQAVYLISGGAIIFILNYFLELFALFIVGAPIAGLALALAFATPGDRPFIVYLSNSTRHFFAPKKYIWKRLPTLPAQHQKTAAKKATLFQKLGKQAKKEPMKTKAEQVKNLKDLASLLDRGGRR